MVGLSCHSWADTVMLHYLVTMLIRMYVQALLTS